MKTYAERKEEARQKAIDFQMFYSQYNYSWEEISLIQNYFEGLGKRYGLLTEFRENAIC